MNLALKNPRLWSIFLAMVKAVFAGTFDPPTLGHLNIIERSSRLFDQLDVLVSVNPDKHALFSDTERMEMLLKLTKDYPNVTVHKWDSLVVDYCKNCLLYTSPSPRD